MCYSEIVSRWKIIPTNAIFTDVPSCPGVYAIYKGNELVYVGQTSNLRKRLTTHRCSARGGNTRRLTAIDCLGTTALWFKVRPCDHRFGEWLSLEYRLLRRLRPKLNRTVDVGAEESSHSLTTTRCKVVQADVPLDNEQKCVMTDTENTISDVVLDYDKWVAA